MALIDYLDEQYQSIIPPYLRLRTITPREVIIAFTLIITIRNYEKRISTPLPHTHKTQ